MIDVRGSVRTSLALAAAAALMTAAPGSAAAPGQAQVSIGSAYNIDCIAPAHLNEVDGDCDNGFQSYVDGSGMPAAGRFVARGIAFTFPSRGLRTNNAIAPTGQRVVLPGRKGYHFLLALMSAVNAGSGKRGGTMIVTYSDGSTAKVPLAADDWATHPNNAVVTTDGQGTYAQPGAPVFALTVHMFIESIAVNPTKVPVALTLPGIAGNVLGGDSPSNGLRIFAMTLSSTPPTAAGGPVFH